MPLLLIQCVSRTLYFYYRSWPSMMLGCYFISGRENGAVEKHERVQKETLRGANQNDKIRKL